jgi:hypothetical protein
MRIIHIIPGLDEEAPQSLKHEFILAQSSISSAAHNARQSGLEVEVNISSFAENGFAPEEKTASYIQNLKRDINSVVGSGFPRLPLLRDVMDLQVGAADFVVYTNADIIVAPVFYKSIESIIASGTTSFSINRRTVRSKSDLSLAEIFAQAGEPHRGTDCVVMPVETFHAAEYQNTIIGIIGLGRTLLLNMAAADTTTARMKDLHLTYHLEDPREWGTGLRNTVGKDFNQQQFTEVWNRLADRYTSVQLQEAAARAEIPVRFLPSPG